MRLILLNVVFFLLLGNLVSQTKKSISTETDVVKYHKVKMEGNKTLANQLLIMGITIDHAEVSEGNIVSEISDSELAILKNSNVKYTVLIPDMANYYEQRILSDYKNKISAAASCNAPDVKKPTWFHLGSMGGYFTLAQMEIILDSMKLLYPNLITTKAAISTTKSVQNRNIWFVKISDNPAVDENEPELLYSSLHHAREAASLSQLIFYMYYILENYNTNPDIKFLVDNTEMYFVPCVNPDGYFYNQTIQPNGGGMWRKNRRNNGNGTFGIDLNRNYGYNWGYDNIGSSPNSNSDTYRGPTAFSEPETQAMRNFINGRQFKTALNAHTYSNLLIYPWGYLPSYYTPDSATFVNWGVHLTESTRYLYGTGDQTVNYVTNGSSDDWMYGEQGSKPKMLAMTPEAGSAADGFWPASSRIIDICKTTYPQNITLAKLVTNYALVHDDQDWFISGNGYIKYNIQRLGLTNGDFTVSVLPVGYGIGSTGSPKLYSVSSLTLNQVINDSISFTMGGFVNQGQPIKYALAINNGIYTHYDTITKLFGTPIIVLNDAGNNTSNWNASTWATTTASFKSPPSSITDSPGGDYGPNSNVNCVLINNLNLSGANYAHLQYYTKFQLEKNFDFVQIMGSTNGGSTWFSICAPHETSPSSFGGTDPLYDGLQDKWIKEEIDISSYAGQNLLLSFNLTTDGGDEQDGFYFDDVLVRKLASTSTDIKQINVDGELILYPNPTNGILKIKNMSGAIYEIKLFNNLGKEVSATIHISSTDFEKNINLLEQPAGIYFAQIKKGTEIFIKKIIVTK